MDGSKLVTSAANPAVKKLRSLAVKKYREEENLFLVEGTEYVAGALKAGWRAEMIAFSREVAGSEIIRQAAGAELLETTYDILSKIVQRDNAPTLVAAFRPQWSNLNAIAQGLWVGLENIRDPGNLGTIIRTADAVGAAGVILVGETCDSWAPETIRASAGSFARIKIARAAEKEFLEWKKNWPGRAVGTHLRGTTDYRAAQYGLPLLLMMGGEQAGLSNNIADACDELVKIPMAGGTESLNLAVSTGIMLYEIRRPTL
ncbi:MAG TPA: RNA methyltransferase [Alphaproteobacteria bacterium]|jgi:TrmH family RNA methyltransferase